VIHQPSTAKFNPKFEFEQKITPMRRVVELTSIIPMEVMLLCLSQKYNNKGVPSYPRNENFKHLDLFEESMPVNILVPVNRMRLLTEVLEDVDTPQDVREFLVFEDDVGEIEQGDAALLWMRVLLIVEACWKKKNTGLWMYQRTKTRKIAAKVKK